MTSLQDFVSNYGYAAVAIGSFLEGETILILGGFAAHRGYLELPWVIVSAFCGSLFGDQLYFHIGYFKGPSIIKNNPKWKTKSEKVFSLLHRHEVLLILGFRFLYGLRTITPFILGASKVSPLRFLLLNILGASIWATVIGLLGYLFGQTLEVILGDIKRFEWWVFFGIGVVAVLLWVARLLLKK